MEGAGNNIIAVIENGKCPNTIPDTATTLSGFCLTIPFQTACINVARRTIKKTLFSMVRDKFILLYHICLDNEQYHFLLK